MGMSELSAAVNHAVSQMNVEELDWKPQSLTAVVKWGTSDETSAFELSRRKPKHGANTGIGNITFVPYVSMENIVKCIYVENKVA